MSIPKRDANPTDAARICYPFTTVKSSHNDLPAIFSKRFSATHI
jgi:hypothetical protein